jgi:drug/metabolite transporter (DMT)-like permease
MNPVDRLPSWRAELALAAIALIWGATFVLVKDALNDITPALFLAIRFSVATIALVTVVSFRPSNSPESVLPEAAPKYGLIRGGLFTGTFLYSGYLLQTIGLKYISPAKSGFITGLYIVLVPFFGAAVYKSAPQIAEVVGVAAAFLGLALLTSEGDLFAMGKGDLLTVGAAIAFAVHLLAVAHYSRRTSYEWLAVSQLGVCAGLALATCWLVESPAVLWSGRVWLAIGVTSLLATALAFALQTWAQRYTTATRAAIIFALEPVFAWLTSFVVANEVLSKRAVSGALCILAGILLVELKPFSRRTHPVS